jgi:DNA-binding CsgD family transcriptional regulator
MSYTGVRERDENEGRLWAELIRRSATGENVARIFESHADLDATDLLPSIKCPTVVCHSLTDSEFPFALAQKMAEAIPNAQMVPLESGSGPFVNPGANLEVLDRYLPPPRGGAPPSTRQARRAQASALTPRETEILRLIAGGMTSKEISASLSLSIRTVGRHVTNIYEKIGAHNRADATAYALRHGITRE